MTTPTPEPPAEGALASLVREQAEDDGLWFEAVTAAEGYLQQELRRLHAAVESAVAPPVEDRRDVGGDDR